MKKKVLILGNSIKAYTFARKLSESCDVYITAQNSVKLDYVETVDIREDSVKELLEFVLENDIDMTIVTSVKALMSDVVDIFDKNNQPIFAPNREACKMLFDKTYAKKLLYKLRIPTPKFGIFDKSNMVMEYIKNSEIPFVLKTNSPLSAVVITDKNVARSVTDFYFMENQQKVIIEDYVWGTPFAFYAVTDGYKALPLSSSIVYKHSLEGDGGQLTSGMGACSPNYKLSADNENYLMEKVIYPTLNYLESEGNNYIGIIGVEGIIAEDGRLQILGYQPFMQDCDCNGILELIDDKSEIYDICNSCIVGSFSDEYDKIFVKDFSAVTVALTCTNKHSDNNVISGIDDIDDDITYMFYPNISKNKYFEYEAENGNVMLLTSVARTVNAAVNKVYQNIEKVDFRGKKYRRDICKPNCEV